MDNPAIWLITLIVVGILCCVGAFVGEGISAVIVDIRTPGVCNNLDFNLTVSNAQVLLKVTNHNDFAVKFNGVNTYAVRKDDLGGRHKHDVAGIINPGVTEAIVITEFSRLSKQDGIRIESVEKYPDGRPTFKCNITIPFSDELVKEIELEYERACNNVQVFDLVHEIAITNNNNFPIRPKLADESDPYIRFYEIRPRRTETMIHTTQGDLRLLGIEDRRQLFDYIECNMAINP